MSYIDIEDRKRLNYNRFTESDGSDYDYRKYERSFSGRMTKRRWQIINRFCRHQTYRIHIASDYDCTGQCCGQSMEFTYSRNQVIVRLCRSYDY
jgi:hypothetical protein